MRDLNSDGAVRLVNANAVKVHNNTKDVVPAYTTDALLRRVNVDRYDDREIVETNLIESYEKLLAFVQKHLLDKFFLENGQRISLRYIIARELVSNILMHREYTSPHHARIVIESNKIYTVNASRATQEILITPANLEPISKNPIIAKFFREIGFADTMGSGVRKLFKYTKPYSAKIRFLKRETSFGLLYH